MTEAIKVEVDTLLRAIRQRFYNGLTEKRFFQDRPTLELAITWPATWLRARGITWTTERYFQALDGLLSGVLKHGASPAQITYFPGYLLKVVQDHFAHHGDTYCLQGKTLRNAMENALNQIAVSAGQNKKTEIQSTTDILAAAHAVLASRRRATRVPKTHEKQTSLF